MSASIPPAPTLSINAGDTVNVQGVAYTVASVAAGVDNGNGLVTYAVTLVGGQVVTMDAYGSIVSDVLTNGHQDWSRSPGYAS